MVVYSFFFLFFFENGSLEHFFHLFESVIFSIKAHIVLLVGQSYSVLKCTWSEQMNESPNLVIATVEWKKVLITLIPLKAKGKPFGTLLTLCVCKKKKKKEMYSLSLFLTDINRSIQSYIFRFDCRLADHWLLFFCLDRVSKLKLLQNANGTTGTTSLALSTLDLHTKYLHATEVFMKVSQ